MNIILTIKINEWRFTKPSSGVPNRSSTITEKSLFSMKTITKYEITAAVNEAIALFNLFVKISTTTARKHKLIMI
jgi:hypothetical protein